MNGERPTVSDVLAARRTISPYLRPTALYRYDRLGRSIGAEVWVKHENHQPVGAFKVRGGVNLVANLSEAERRRGISAATTGNHGQSLAFAGRLFGVRVVVFVPEGANPLKVDAMRDLGAEVIAHGRDFDEARERCEEVSKEEGFRYVHSGNEPLLIAGVATETLEILEEQPYSDTVVVPVGGGSGAAGACIVAKSLRPATKVVGVQSEAAPAAFLSWRARRVVEDRTATFAEGLATRTGFELPQRILWDLLDDFVLVSEDDLRFATRELIEVTRNLVEGAGAAAWAGARKIADRLAGTRVAVICSGGNVNPVQLVDLLS